MFSETYFCALFSSKIFWNVSAILETAAQTQSTAQLAVRLSKECGLHDDREAARLMLTHMQTSLYNVPVTTGRPVVGLKKPKRHLKKHQHDHMTDRSVAPQCSGVSSPDLVYIHCENFPRQECCGIAKSPYTVLIYIHSNYLWLYTVLPRFHCL